VTLHGLIGDDAPGCLIQQVLARENLTFVYDIDPKGTQRHANLMDDGGGRISIYIAYATFEPEIDLERIDACVSQSDMVVINLSNYCRRIIPLANSTASRSGATSTITTGRTSITAILSTAQTS
jgi:hypothetical protein